MGHVLPPFPFTGPTLHGRSEEPTLTRRLHPSGGRRAWEFEAARDGCGRILTNGESQPVDLRYDAETLIGGALFANLRCVGVRARLEGVRLDRAHLKQSANRQRPNEFARDLRAVLLTRAHELVDFVVSVTHRGDEFHVARQASIVRHAGFDGLPERNVADPHPIAGAFPTPRHAGSRYTLDAAGSIPHNLCDSDLTCLGQGERGMDDLLKDHETAGYLKVPVGTLANWRYQGKGPRFIKVGRHVRYRRSDVEAWLELHVRDSTAVSP
jgi:excisionase family DNA binding protein